MKCQKYFSIDQRSIELLLPIRTKTGLNLTFYIRSKMLKGNLNDDDDNGNSHQQQQVMELVCNEVESGYLAKAIRVAWKLTMTPTINNLETKELNPGDETYGIS